VESDSHDTLRRYYLVYPPPDGLALHAWQMFAIFAATIFAIILKVLPMGAVTMIALIVSAFLGVTPLSRVKATKLRRYPGLPTVLSG
jgi:DASS family divalent anion:Na+ symporter